MKKVEDMTIGECARELGFKTCNRPVCEDCKPSLDAIAGAMPEGWYLLQLNWSSAHGFNACGGRGDPSRHWSEFADAAADTEILARARLAVSCWRATKPSGDA